MTLIDRDGVLNTQSNSEDVVHLFRWKVAEVILNIVEVQSLTVIPHTMLNTTSSW